ncbi:MAG: HAMP domain-containing protein [Deltaproteobacteria bacterium]|nr:HAMP domain-containing protein [Deltaproteobacteria bacterium]MBN2674354.1 HAMP domain-containing protein [Deltaproteobacteria bacterium]
MSEGRTNSNTHLKYSVSNRVVIGLAMIIAIFTGLMVYSLVIYKRSVHEMNLINKMYVPLALGTSEIQSTQVIFNTLMDRLQEEPNHPMTRDWLNAARKYRPERLTRLIDLIDNLLSEQGQFLPRDEVTFLRELRARLRDVRRRYRMNENKFVRLFTVLDMGKASDAISSTENLKRSERLLNKVLQGIGTDVRTHITDVSLEAVENGNMATVVLSILGSLALILGITIVVSTRHLLAPLKQLQQAVSKVAAGDFGTRTHIQRNDEIGVLADNFNHMTNALEERDKRLIRSERLATAGRIAAQVTHEIRNPLSSLDLNADLLKDEIGPDGSKEEALQLLGAMQDEIERLTRITEAYLRFARLPAPSIGRHRLHSVIENTVDFMATELADSSIAVQLHLDAESDNAFFDKEQMVQVMMNLIRNGIQAMPSGGTLHIATRQTDEELILRVEDTGSGIPHDSIANIFDPFFTTKSEGTGLGLAMVRQICLAHDGNIQYIDAETQGAVFEITLPTQKRIRNEKTAK